MAKIFDKHKKNVILNLIQGLLSKGVNVFSLSKGEGQGEGLITNLRKELINLSTYPLINFNKNFPRPLRERARERGKRNHFLTSLPTNLLTFKPAFTLAEVLITLGIIGIVAAMTIPTLMTKYAKQRTETQLVKFYSMMNQTLRMSVADNGDPEGWVTPNKNYTYDENVEFLKTYIFPYMKHLGYKQWPDQENENNKRKVVTTLMDGGVMSFRVDVNGGDIAYYTDEKWLTDNTNIQRHRFAFQFAKKGMNNTINSLNYIEPYIFGWNGTREYLIGNPVIYGCKLIQMNSWKIPSDYPW